MTNISITPDNKVTKIILKEGYGPLPKKGQIVVVKYEGRIKKTGKVFDSSKINRENFKFLLGKDKVIDGLTVAVSSMHLGEKSTFTFDPDYGYGDLGNIPTIPPKAVLEFDIELYDIRDKFYNAIDADKKAKEICEEANKLYNEKKYTEALVNYRRAFHTVDEWVNGESQKLKIQIARNLANCYGMTKNWQKELKKADYVLKHDKEDTVALYRKAEALVELKQFDQAKHIIENELKATKNNTQFVELNNRLGKFGIHENPRKNVVHSNC